MGRKQSRRVTLKKKHRIEKKVTDHHRKLRKLSKGIKKRARKDPGIPNMLPFKEEILKEVSLKKQQIKEEEERKKEAKKTARVEAKLGPKNLEDLRTDAEARTKEYQVANHNCEPKERLYNAGVASRKYYFKEFKKVVLAADVIFEVLDARDPLSCRCPEVEQEIVKSGKKLVLLLNKIDLVPKQNVVDWVTYLRREFPTLPIKASTQKQKRALGAFKLKFAKSTSDNLANSKSFGIDLIMRLLGNYSRNNDIKTAITIGIIGLPNVGKSSIINSLVRSKACSAGGLPGITKSMQEVNLDSKIKLLDSPGIVMQKDVDQNSMILRSCVPLRTVSDCLSVVDYMIKKMKGTELNLRYKVPPFSTTEEFLASVARKRGILRKGGVANVQKAARTVLYDWHKGAISYYTVPPKVPQEMETENDSNIEIISKFSKEIDIDALLEEAHARIPDGEHSIISGKIFVPVETEGKVKSVSDALLEQETIIEIKGPFAKKPSGQKTQKQIRTTGAKTVKHMEANGAGKELQGEEDLEEDVTDDDYSDVDEEIQFKKLECSDEQMLTFNKQMKLHLKKMKRKKLRTERLDSQLAEKVKKTMDINTKEIENQQSQEYDFTEHFVIPARD